MICSFPGPTGDVQCFSGAAEESTEGELRHKRRQKHAVITRLQQLGPVEFGSHERRRELLEQAFDDGNDELK